MKNEIGRKITSLTLMTIMVAGGMTIANPGVLPSAHAATENLFVSAENSQFDNSFAGPMVIEVVVNDPDLKEIDENEAEPDVTVNGQDLQMIQATDGLWYAYFADVDMATTADATSPTSGVSLDFGILCPDGDAADTIRGTDPEITYTDTDGVFFPGVTTTDGTACAIDDDSTPADIVAPNVIREAKTPSRNTVANDRGQVGLALNEFPMIQLYDFAVDGKVEVKYNKGGGVQQIDLTYLDDADSYAGLSLDRTEYPFGAKVHFTITDLQLNIDPTDEDSWTFGTNTDDGLGISPSTRYQVFDENGELGNEVTNVADGSPDLVGERASLNFDDNGILLVNPDSQNRIPLLDFVDNSDQDSSAVSNLLSEDNNIVTVVETQANSGIFKNTDEGDNSNIIIHDEAKRGLSASIDYNNLAKPIGVGNFFATLTIDKSAVGDTWNSGEQVPVKLTDGDMNRNSLVDEDLDLNDPNVDLIPSVRIGNPITLAGTDSVIVGSVTIASDNQTVDGFSDRLQFRPSSDLSSQTITFQGALDNDEAVDFFAEEEGDAVSHFLNYDFRSVGSVASIAITDGTTSVPIGTGLSDDQDTELITADVSALTPAHTDLVVTLSSDEDIMDENYYPVVIDVFSFGQTDDGVSPNERVNNAIYRLELEESGDNTNIFEGFMEYLMLNQLNVNNPSSYTGNIDSISNDIEIIVHNDLTDEDDVRINYLDLGEDGVSTQVADQIAAPTHSGVVSFDADNYKIADTVTVTVNDPDLNTDLELLDIFTVVTDTTEENANRGGDDQPDNFNVDVVGTADDPSKNLGRLLDITFDDQLWTQASIRGCTVSAIDSDDGLGATGFTLKETTKDSGIFKGTFQVPATYCPIDPSVSTDEPVRTGFVSTTGVDMEVNYVDYRDLSGEIIEVGDSAGIRANTGSVSFDRPVYPVPFGLPEDFHADRLFVEDDAVFPIHFSGIDNENNRYDDGEYIPNGDLIVHVRVNDPDFDISASGEDTIAVGTDTEDFDRGPVMVSVTRGSEEVILATAGGDRSFGDRITVGDTIGDTNFVQFEAGPILEVAPDAGVFELDLPVRYTDGPEDSECPNTLNTLIEERFVDEDGIAVRDTTDDYCVLQGDIITVVYSDPTDASGNENTVTDSATFDLRNGILQSDKSAYIIGSDMILTLIEPDFDLENDERETYSLDLIEWDSDDATLTMGSLGGSNGAFDPEPSDFRETGDSTGIFQVVIEIPEALQGDNLDRGEPIELEYTDWGPSGADHVGDDDQDVNLVVLTSNFGATIELDQKVYSWTDKVYITILAPDHNFDSDLIDEIGETRQDSIKVKTGEGELDQYRLTETGTDTGIFTGEVILTGFTHDADGDVGTGNQGFDVITEEARGTGPTGGFLPATEDDGVSVSFEFTEDETVVGSSLIRWNLGEVTWLEASYAASGTGTVRVVDPDMNWNPEAVDNFDVDVRSDSDTGGIDLTVTETNQATGIFEGTVTFSTTDESEGHRIFVAEGDTVKAEYDDNTLPDLPGRSSSPTDEEQITATTFIGTIVPPLERAVIENPRLEDGSGNPLAGASVDTRVHLTADLTSGQDKPQDFAYLVQIKDSDGVIVKLDWIDGNLAPGQTFSPSQSWVPDTPGAYTVTLFAWESVNNPTALSPKAEISVNVN